MPLDTSSTGQQRSSPSARGPSVPTASTRSRAAPSTAPTATAPGQLIGRVLRSPHAHATIRKIDTSKAEKLAGVKAVITAADLPDLTDGDRGMRDILDNCMARNKVLYDGHAVAAVAAVDARTARQGAEAHQGRLRGPAACDRCRRGDEAHGARPPRRHLHRRRRAQADQALQRRQAHRVRPWRCRGRASSEADCHRRAHLQDRADAPGLYRAACLPGQRQPRRHRASSGSAPRAISSTATLRRSCSAWMSRSCASPSSEIGGGFGGKTHVWAEPVALALSRKANRPVKLVMTRDEVFRASGPTSATSIDVKIGAKKDGTITAAEATLRYSRRRLSPACGPSSAP